MPQKLLSLVSSVQSSENVDSLLELECFNWGHIMLLGIFHCNFTVVMFSHKVHNQPEIRRLFKKMSSQ